MSHNIVNFASSGHSVARSPEAGDSRGTHKSMRAAAHILAAAILLAVGAAGPAFADDDNNPLLQWVKGNKSAMPTLKTEETSGNTLNERKAAAIIAVIKYHLATSGKISNSEQLLKILSKPSVSITYTAKNSINPLHAAGQTLDATTVLLNYEALFNTGSKFNNDAESTTPKDAYKVAKTILHEAGHVLQKENFWSFDTWPFTWIGGGIYLGTFTYSGKPWEWFPEKIETQLPNTGFGKASIDAVDKILKERAGENKDGKGKTGSESRSEPSSGPSSRAPSDKTTAPSDRTTENNNTGVNTPGKKTDNSNGNSNQPNGKQRSDAGGGSDDPNTGGGGGGGGGGGPLGKLGPIIAGLIGSGMPSVPKEVQRNPPNSDTRSPPRIPSEPYIPRDSSTRTTPSPVGGLPPRNPTNTASNPATPSGNPPATTTGGSNQGTEPTCIYLLNISGGSVWVGTETQLKGSRTCDFSGGGECKGKNDPPPAARKQACYPNTAAAEAAWCQELRGRKTTTPPSYLFGTKAEVFGGNYWIESAPTCPAATPATVRTGNPTQGAYARVQPHASTPVVNPPVIVVLPARRLQTAPSPVHTTPQGPTTSARALPPRPAGMPTTTRSGNGTHTQVASQHPQTATRSLQPQQVRPAAKTFAKPQPRVTRLASSTHPAASTQRVKKRFGR